MKCRQCWGVSLPRLLLSLAALPVCPALLKQLCAGCVSLQHCSGSLWTVLTCWEAPGVRTGTMGTKELVVVPPQLRCSGRGRERSAVRRRNCWHGQAGPAEPSPSPVAPWGELEPHPSPGGLGGLGFPMTSAPSPLRQVPPSSLASPLPNVSAQSRGDQRCSACLGCCLPPGSPFPSLQDPAGHLCPNSCTLSAPATSTAVGHTLDTCSGCRGATAVGIKGVAMSVGASEPKSPSLAAGAPQGPLRGGQALREDGEDGS